MGENYETREIAGEAAGRLYEGDNLALLKRLADDPACCGRIRMIYVDPPFFTKAAYRSSLLLGRGLPALKMPAYEDRWTGGMDAYLAMLRDRLILMRELLADDGLLWVHLDWHAVHYVKVMLDQIFGPEHFINEIIWQYKSGGSSKRHFARKHDTLLLYAKTKDYRLHVGKEKSYNRGRRPYRFRGVEEFCDEMGWYTMVNQKDVWQIDMVGRTSAERTGYATQKPLVLMRRIIESSTEEGDLCADFFCGSGSLPVAAAMMGRRFLACDRSSSALNITRKRLLEEGCGFVYRQQVPKASSSQEDAAGDLPAQVQTDGNTEQRCSVSGRACFQVRRMPDGSITVQLVDYVLSGGALSAGGTTAQIKVPSQLDARRLIAYWSVDEADKAAVHRSCHVAFPSQGEKGMVMQIPAYDRCAGADRISIMTVDLLGGTSRQILSVDGSSPDCTAAF